MGYILDHSDAKAVFVDNEFAQLVSANLSKLPKVKTLVNICDISPEKPLDGPDYETFLTTGAPDPVPILVDDEHQVATINYTSGTTGLPKGVMYHHRGAYLNAIGEMLEIKFTPEFGLPLDPAHVSLQRVVLSLGRDGHGRHPCVSAQVVAKEIFRLIETEDVSHLWPPRPS